MAKGTRYKIKKMQFGGMRFYDKLEQRVLSLDEVIAILNSKIYFFKEAKSDGD